jgi:hypothetical protein
MPIANNELSGDHAKLEPKNELDVDVPKGESIVFINAPLFGLYI